MNIDYLRISVTDRCEIFKQVGDCIVPREGVFTKVIKPGVIKVGDGIDVLND